jgi:hypothetical protein
MPMRAPLPALRAFSGWIGDSLDHAFGNPREEQANLPPNVGVQPYRDDPHRR